MAGLPVIATDWNGYRDLIDDGVTGLRVPTSMHETSEGLSILLTLFPDARERHVQRVCVDLPELRQALRALATIRRVGLAEWGGADRGAGAEPAVGRRCCRQSGSGCGAIADRARPRGGAAARRGSLGPPRTGGDLPTTPWPSGAIHPSFLRRDAGAARVRPRRPAAVDLARRRRRTDSAAAGERRGDVHGGSDRGVRERGPHRDRHSHARQPLSQTWRARRLRAGHRASMAASAVEE